VRGRLYLPNLRYELHYKICNLRYGTHGYGMSAYEITAKFSQLQVFKWLAKHNHVMVIAWIYVFTLILVITFAIEIGQKVTNTGAMEFADIVFGVVGFIVMFFIFSIIREIYHLICRLIKYLRDQNWGKR
jgi:glycopeptide antibiotics resistance protein